MSSSPTSSTTSAPLSESTLPSTAISDQPTTTTATTTPTTITPTTTTTATTTTTPATTTTTTTTSSQPATFSEQQVQAQKKFVLDNKIYKAFLPALFDLLEVGCCPHCAFRFANQRTLSLYQQKPELLHEVILSLKREVSGDPTATISPPPGPCIACLGILSDTHSSEFTTSLLGQLGNSGYQFRNYTLTVTLPNALLIRQYSLWYFLKQKYPGEGVLSASKTADEVVDVKEAMKWLLGPMISYRLAFDFKNGADFRVNLIFTHPETQDEAQFLTQIEGSPLRPRKFKKDPWRTDMAPDSLNSVTKALRSIPMNSFLKFGNCPPKHTTTKATFQLEYEHASVFICGRYNKYARDVCQSGEMWVSNDKVCETSVDRLILPAIKEAYQADYAKFSGSGREDMDVRMLGDGRPFMVELVNPHKVFFKYEDFREMENKINSATDKVKASWLQPLYKSDMSKLKDAEDTKRKRYRCIVWVEKQIKPEDLEFLKNIKDLELNQKTPIRVLHRRSLADRKKIIHGLTYEYTNEHFLTLDVYAQAGTYIKEFIHGDLGRTLPNFGTLMGCNADILQLDVMQIEIDFPSPPQVGPKKKGNNNNDNNNNNNNNNNNTNTTTTTTTTTTSDSTNKNANGDGMDTS